MNDKRVDDILKAVAESDVVKQALAGATEEERRGVEGTIAEFAKLLSPFVAAVEALESEEVAQAVRDRLAEKLRSG